MSQECQGLRKANQVLMDRLHSLSQKAASAADTVTVLSSRLASLERDRETLKSLLSAERARAAEMEEVASGARRYSSTSRQQHRGDSVDLDHREEGGHRSREGEGAELVRKVTTTMSSRSVYQHTVRSGDIESRYNRYAPHHHCSLLSHPLQ